MSEPRAANPPVPLMLVAGASALALVLGLAARAFQGAGYAVSLATIPAWLLRDDGPSASGGEQLVVLVCALVALGHTAVVLASLGAVLALLVHPTSTTRRLTTALSVLVVISAVPIVAVACLGVVDDSVDVGPGPWLFGLGAVGLIVCRVLAGRPHPTTA